MAAIARKFKFKTPIERVLHVSWLLTSTLPHEVVIEQLKAVVQLACGHYALIRGLDRSRCPRCQRMFDVGEDWDGFRHLGYEDAMEWPDDPCRGLNERGWRGDE